MNKFSLYTTLKFTLRSVPINFNFFITILIELSNKTKISIKEMEANVCNEYALIL